MRTAIVSDIHGNLEALTAVMEDIKSQKCDRIFCLGDIIGYGPNPRECLDIVMTMQMCVIGNHDYGALIDPEGFTLVAEQAIFWTRQQVEESIKPGDAKARLSFLAKLPRVYTEEGVVYVHGSVSNPINEYVFPDEAYSPRKMERLFSLIQRYSFQGHTHMPGVFTADHQFFAPPEFQFRYELTNAKAMINVGSVGQPRDEDWRSCYVIYDHPHLEFRRVEYDVATTRQKILEIPELDSFLGERLLRGG